MVSTLALHDFNLDPIFDPKTTFVSSLFIPFLLTLGDCAQGSYIMSNI